VNEAQNEISAARRAAAHFFGEEEKGEFAEGTQNLDNNFPPLQPRQPKSAQTSIALWK
jgi:hypothetical protein